MSGSRWARAGGILALLGGTLGVALDAMHVASHTTSYAEPWIAGIATWTIPLFASAAVALGLAPVAIEHALAAQKKIALPEPPSAARAGLAMLAFVGAYLASCVLRGAIGAGVLFAIATAVWWLVDRRALGALHALGAAIGGASVESALVHAGAFTHYDAAIAGVPLWLPCLYLSASLATSGLARRVIARS